MNRTDSPSPSKWAMVLLTAATLALAGCGRKGPLDLPANAGSAALQADEEAEQAAKPGVFNPSYGADSLPATPKGRKKSFILDPLLGN